MTRKEPAFTLPTAAAEDVGTIRRDTDAAPAAARLRRTALRGRMVQTPGEDQPYKAVMEHSDRAPTEHPVATMAEGEALIRRETPRPPERDRTRERPRD
jgi:hypothetical protein